MATLTNKSKADDLLVVLPTMNTERYRWGVCRLRLAVDAVRRHWGDGERRRLAMALRILAEKLETNEGNST